MVYYTGDIHGNPMRLEVFCQRWNLSDSDILVLLGDVGANYYMGKQDDETKRRLDDLGPIIFCIHGNHEIRPHHIPTYKSKQWNGGTVFYEEKYPNLLFAQDGEIYSMDGLEHLVIGGAYSVDKYYRIARGYHILSILQINFVLIRQEAIGQVSIYPNWKEDYLLPASLLTCLFIPQ